MNKKQKITRKVLAAITLAVLYGSAFAQQIVDSGDLRIITDEQRGASVHYLKDGKRPLSGEYRILRGQDEESVYFSKGVMQGEYKRYRNGVLREKGTYADGKRHGLFVTYYQDGKTPQREAPMQHGKIEGTVKTWFSDGKPDMVQEYRLGKRNGKEQRFDPKTASRSMRQTIQMTEKREHNGKSMRMSPKDGSAKSSAIIRITNWTVLTNTRLTCMASCTSISPARTRMVTSMVRGQKSTVTTLPYKVNIPRVARRDIGCGIIS